MAKKKKITIEKTEIAISNFQGNDYVSLTDMVSSRDPYKIIENWLRTRTTLNFLGAWEQVHNKEFDLDIFENIMRYAGDLNFTMSVKKWVETGAVGIMAKPGRYGGTFAHPDIAFEFAMAISPLFKVLLIKEFKRLKDEESRRIQQNWDYRRFLTKVNYQLHTDTIKDTILPRINAPQNRKFIVYAEEADMLNLAVFGQTARQWKEENPQLAKKGNMRDYADVLQLTILANLESTNSVLIEQGMHKEDRFEILVRAADSQYRRLAQNLEVKKLDDKK